MRAQLSVDSPERDAVPDDDFDMSGPKDLLSYSWRALRDSNLLLGAAIENREIDDAPNADSILFFKRCANLVFSQMSELRHRGAFCTVSQTWADFWKRLMESNSTSIKTLHAHWYAASMNIIDEQSEKLTRRSAGIPMLVSGLLLSATSQFLDEALWSFMQRVRNFLLDQSQPFDRLPEVHILNCLREICVNSTLRAKTEKHVMSMLDLAIRCLDSKVWAIRNCGLMLFRACTKRLGSVRSGKSQSDDKLWQNEDKISADRVPAILSAVRTMMVQDRTATDTEFAILDLLARMPPSSISQDDISVRLTTYLLSPVYMIRQHAARILATAEPANREGLEKIADLIVQRSNGEHGFILLCLALKSHISNFDLNHMPKFYIRNEVTCAALLQLGILQVEQALLRQDVAHTYEAVPGPAITDLCEALLDQLGSATFCNKILRQEITLYQSLRSLITDAHTRPLHFLSGISANDEQLISYIVSRLVGHMWPARIQKLIYQKFIDLVQGASDNLAAILMISICRITTTYGLRSLLKYQEVSEEFQALTMWTEYEAMKLSHNREFCNALLILQAHLYKHNIQSTSRDGFSWWILRLQQASHDLIDTRTRTSAIDALAVMQQELSKPGHIPEIGRIQLLLILYDILNDDDDAVRDAACTITTTIVSGDKGSALDAIGSRLTLRNYLSSTSATSDLVTRSAILRLIYPYEVLHQPMRKLFRDLASTHSVASLLGQWKRSNTIVFAEERQNLYVNEVEEVDTWAQILLDLDLLVAGTAYLAAVVQWTIEGCKILKRELENRDWDGPLGFSTEREGFVLFMRVAGVAKVFLGSFKSGIPSRLATILVDLRSEIIALRYEGRRKDWHYMVDKAFERALTMPENPNVGLTNNCRSCFEKTTHEEIYCQL